MREAYRGEERVVCWLEMRGKRGSISPGISLSLKRQML